MSIKNKNKPGLVTRILAVVVAPAARAHPRVQSWRARALISYRFSKPSHSGMAFLLPLDSGREGEGVKILDKSKHKHGRLHRRVGVTLSALVAAASMAFAPAAMADMQGLSFTIWVIKIIIRIKHIRRNKFPKPTLQVLTL